ncbi:DMT family transporter [Leeia oryzae]|uniref:DMT family transporter n=1 Tax=Leeia oryzae TaxID=356662 RepID=UPI0004778C2A|nr:DMT family transporter [Leeia oryzae]
MVERSRHRHILSVFGLMFAAGVWGALWFPYRWLAAHAIGPDIAQIANYAIAVTLGGVVLFGVMKRPWAFSKEIAWMGISAGWSNVGYVFAILHADVMRITLLFYLAPVWTLALAWFALGEKPNRYGMLVFVLSFAGAICMLWQPALGAPVPKNGYEWVALSGGVAFALNNVLSRKASHIDPAVKSFSVWSGCLIMALLATVLFKGQPQVLAQMPVDVWGVLIFIGCLLVMASVLMQVGLRYIGATQAIVIMLFELVVAALTTWWIAGEVMSLREWIGGIMIVAASLFSGQLAHTEEEHA